MSDGTIAARNYHGLVLGKGPYEDALRLVSRDKGFAGVMQSQKPPVVFKPVMDRK